MIHETMAEKKWIVLRETKIPTSHDKYVQPDLIAIHPTKPMAFVLDVRIPYEQDKDSLARKDIQKRNKYQAHDNYILDYIRFHYPEITRVEYYGLIFGSRGSIHCVTLNLLKDTFKFSDLRLSAIIDKVVYESLQMYSLFHIGGQLPETGNFAQHPPPSGHPSRRRP